MSESIRISGIFAGIFIAVWVICFIGCRADEEDRPSLPLAIYASTGTAFLVAMVLGTLINLGVNDWNR
jgi:hypothetical protein